jgi:hypothetical protein
MKTLLIVTALAIISGNSSAAIITGESPHMAVLKVERETGKSGVCAATSRVLVCMVGWEQDAVRRKLGSSAPSTKGTWEIVHESGMFDGKIDVQKSTWVRVCFEGICEIWPRSVFTYKVNS